MESELVTLLDELAEREGYANRSEALRSLVRKELVRETSPAEETQVAGVVTLLYPYGRKLAEAPIAPFATLQIAANLQLHLHYDVCLKVMVVQGSGAEMCEWARTLVSQKGVVGDISVVASAAVYSALERDKGLQGTNG